MSQLPVELQQAALAILETAINQTLQLDEHASEKLQPLEGSIIGVELKGVGLVIYFRTDSQGIMLQASLEGEPDCLIRGTPIALMKMTLSEQQTSGLFSGEVEIIGDTELGQKMQRVLDSIEIDWEEHLSHLVGDVLAYKFVHTAQQGKQWLMESVTQVAENMTDYLRFEQQNVPIPGDVNEFITDTDKFRDDTARIEARVNRLQEKLAKHIKNT
ncbi:MAG: SCP2 sterol-binding domain-containing protein [Gammaproteobacteria bacterium]|nr:MAG: SCP2 sterol-binding domain-containing protein [Gammaproteobacteria bacterium]